MLDNKLIIDIPKGMEVDIEKRASECPFSNEGI